MQYLLLFLEGIITFISPCILPLLPLYVSYFAAGESAKGKALRNSLGFVVGFTIVFVALGAFAGSLGAVFQEHANVVNIITGVIVVILGLNFLGVVRISFLNATCRGQANVQSLGFFSSVVFGMVFSIGWTPCVGAFLGSALMMAAMDGGTIQGIFMLLLFSLGLGLPFIISALLIDQLKSTFDFIKRNYKVVNTVCGSFLIIMGILMMSGLMGRFLSLLSI